MKHLLNCLPNNKSRIKMKYLRVFLNIYKKENYLATGYINKDIETHLIKLLSYFNASLKHRKEHPSVKELNCFIIEHSDDLEIFLSRYVDLKKDVFNGFERVYNGIDLCFNNDKHLNYYKQPSEFK